MKKLLFLAVVCSSFVAGCSPKTEDTTTPPPSTTPPAASTNSATSTNK